MEKREQKRYYLGLDMGTTSVGWAVTDQEYHLLRAKGKDLWGVRLFSPAETSAGRRSFRVARRRRQREVARIGILREYFETEINKIDPGFYARLDDSKFYKEERGADNQQPFALFADCNYTDKEYYQEYPTIFHLRSELLHSTEPHDVRLLYLAISNMFKHRGHFLNSSLDTEGGEVDFTAAYEELIECAGELGIEIAKSVDAKRIEDTLGEKGVSKRRMAENLFELLQLEKGNKAERALIQMICGFSVKMVDIFGEELLGEENKKLSLTFRASDYQEKADEIQAILGDNFELICVAKQLHDLGLLSSIRKGHQYLSDARMEIYQNHQADLKQLKTVLKRYNQDAYNEMFRIMKDGNYSAYVGSVNSSDGKVRRVGKLRTQEEFYKYLKAVIEKLPQEDRDVKEILKKIEAEAFLQKQRTSSNGVIPNQLHAQELTAILKNAEGYLPFLTERDESGLTVSERIIKLFTFQIPYYVGPLGQQHCGKRGYNVWAKRIAPGKIYPWNLEEKVDVPGAAISFIERMVKHCTYLSGAQALPKQSLLYQKFEVLNELNNLKIQGEKLTVEQKQDIYHQLFTNGKKVTLNKLKTYLRSIGYSDESLEMISGIDGGFNSSLSSLGKFREALGERALCDENRAMIENIIFWKTVYGNDKKFLKEKMAREYGAVLTQEEIKRISGFKFEGWGRLSKEFLTMEGASIEDGEIRSLIGALWDTNENLMELLGSRYTYMESLNQQLDLAEKPLEEWTIEDLDNMYLSAPVKRMVWQTLTILQEIEAVLGNAPERIFVEMAREDGEKGKRTTSRKQNLLSLYKGIKDDSIAWREELEERQEGEFRSKKLYLYYLQQGRCMYTGERIDLDELMKSNSQYDIDHIYPRHFIKDDSLENNLVLVNKAKNARKSDHFPIDAEIRSSRYPFWKLLVDKGFISREKFNRLSRNTELTLEEKAGFINRQLVETRQGTKAITEILRKAFPETEIVFSKAGLVSDFRNQYDLYKVRCINDLHHANDAYLNIVVGNTYFVKFTKNPLNFLKEAGKHPEDKAYQYNMDKVFRWDVKRNGETAWEASSNEHPGTIATVKKVMAKNSPLVTKMCREIHGGITRKSTIWNKEKAKGQGYIPVKMNDPRLQNVSRYGGLSDVTTAGYTLVEYQVKGKNVRSLEALPVYLGRIDTISNENLQEYFSKQIKEENAGKAISDVRICKRFIPLNSLIKYNGFYYYLGGKTGNRLIVRSAVQPCFDDKMMAYIKKIEKAISQNNYMEKDENKEQVLSCERNQELYEQFLEKCEKTVYKYRLGAVAAILKSGKEKFETLGLENQCNVLFELIKNFSQSADTINLSMVGGANTAGKMLINKKISEASEMYLLTQSSTGLFQTKTDLLTV